MDLFNLYENFLENSYDKKLVIFGTGRTADNIIRDFLVSEEIAYFCDNNSDKWGTIFRTKEIVSPDKLVEDNDNIVVIIASVFYDEIFSQLSNLGIKHVYSSKILRFKVLHSSQCFESYKLIGLGLGYGYSTGIYTEGSTYRDNIKIMNQNQEKIQDVEASLSDDKSHFIYKKIIKKMRYNYKFYGDIIELSNNEYFPKDIFTYNDNEIFVDAGTYDGKTSISFAKTTNFKKIYCFEPDDVSYTRTLHNLDKHPLTTNKFELYQMGLYNQNDVVNFNQTGDQGAAIRTTGAVKVKVCKLDDIIDDDVTFIKMDIEGAEIQALQGAQNLIKKYKPKLAICLYHNFSDIWEIPFYIKQLVPDYKFYIRHFGYSNYDTVLYATL